MSLRDYLEKYVQEIHQIIHASKYNKWSCHCPVDNNTLEMLHNEEEKCRENFQISIRKRLVTATCKIMELNKMKIIIPSAHTVRRKIMDPEKLPPSKK